MADFIEGIKLSDGINKKEEKRLKDHLSSLTEEELNSFKRSKSVESLGDEVKIQLEILISEVKSNRLKNTKEYIDISDESMAILKNNPELAKEIKNGKIRFEGNRVVLPDGYENLPKLKQLKRIMHYLNFLEKNSGKDITKENKEEKIQILKELSESSTDFIIDKRFLQYKYMISIYDDILREGYIIEKKTITETNENGDITTSGFEYNIINPENGKKAEGPYAKELLNPRFINPKLLDMTIISSIASRYNLIDQNGTLGQKGIIKFLLNKHGIEGQFGEEIQEESLLLLDWERVDKQLELKMNLYKKKDYKSYQEILFLKNYIGSKEYKNVHYNRQLFTAVNEYKQMFTAEKAIFDAMNSNNIDLNDEKTVGEMISNTLGKNALPLGALGLIMAFFGGKSRTIGLSLLGLAIGGPVVGDIVSKFEKGSKKGKGSIGSFTDEELGLIKTSDIKYSLFNEEYQSQYEKLADLNKTNMKTQYDKESHRKLPFLDSKKLFKIVDVITSKKINFEFDDYDAVDKLSAKLSVKGAITEEDKLKARLEVIETKKEIPKKEEAIKKVNTSIQSKESKISIKEEAIKKAKAENKDTKTLETELNTLKSDLKKLEDDLKKLNKELEDIKQKLGNNQMKLIISSSEFTQEDIKNFLLLLKSPDFNHDEDDETLLDYLSSDGLDTLNKSYESIRFLDGSDDEDTYFNSEINKVLSNDFDKDGNDTRNKEKILKVREKIEELGQTWKNCLEESFNGKAGIYSRIVELKSYIKKTTPELSGKLDSIFDNFEKYAKVKEKLKNYEGIFDDNTLSWSDLTKAINTISFESFDSIKNLEKEQIYTLSIDISKEIKELEKLKIKDEDNNIDPFKNINEKIEKLIKELREKYTNLDDEYREKTGESLGNIDIIISPKEFFEDKEKAGKLESRISRQLNEYVEIIEILKEDKSIGTTSVYLKDAEKIQRELDRYTEKLKGVSVTYKDTDPKIFKTAQKSILKNIRAYEMKKDELKATVKENIKKYYADNQKDLKDLSKLKFNSLEDINNSLAKIDDIKEKSNFSYRYTQKAKEVFLDIKEILNETTGDVIDSEEYKELAKISNEAIEYIYTSIPDVDYQGNFEKIKGFVGKVELALDAYIAKHEAKKELKKQKAKVEGIKESSEEGLSVVQLGKKAGLEAEDLSKSKVKVAGEEVPLDTDATSKKVEEKAEEKKGKAENAAETGLKSLNLDGIEKNKLKPTAKIIMNIRDEFPSNNTIQELSKSKLEILREKYFNETKISEEPSILTDGLKKDASENNLNTFINDLGGARKINEMTIRELGEKIDEYKNEYNNNNTVQISDDTFKETIKVIYNIFKI